MNVDLYSGANLVQCLGANINAASSSFNYATGVPAYALSGVNYRIVVLQSNNLLNYAESFALAVSDYPQQTISGVNVSPLFISANSSITLSWIASPVTVPTVNIDLFAGKYYVQNVASKLTNTQSYTFSLTTLFDSASYAFVVSDS